MEMDDIFVPISKWGRDHWSTLLYIETLVVDKHGQIMMMADPHMRSKMGNSRGGGNPDDIPVGIKYPTRLNDDTTIEMHDDWDCLQDMFVAGVVEWVDGEDERIGLTEKGWKLAGKARQRKGKVGRRD